MIHFHRKGNKKIKRFMLIDLEGNILVFLNVTPKQRRQVKKLKRGLTNGL